MPARRRQWAFTLIELLVVIVIIAILSGIVLGVWGFLHSKTARARAVRDLHQIKNALAEYHATYGIYPPVNSGNVSPGHDTMAWEYRGTDPKFEPRDRHYSTGLVWYLTEDTVPGPSQRDRWKHFLQGVMPNSGGQPVYDEERADGLGNTRWTNNVSTCIDPWERAYRYECYPPFQSYRLWSLGPDPGNPLDDIGVQWDE